MPNIIDHNKLNLKNHVLLKNMWLKKGDLTLQSRKRPLQIYLFIKNVSKPKR
jgi:hypothetical protein